jgi:uncharacterized lipoprotein YmbA
MKRRSLLILLAIISMPLAGGCSVLSPRPDPTKYYVLTPIPGADSVPPAPTAVHNLAIGLGPVQFPDYLARPEVVTRASTNRIELSPTDRWAEPLDQSFRSVLARNLATLLGTDRVVPFPWYASVKLNYKIELTVERFERDGAGGTQLSATWLIRDGLSDKMLVSRQSNFSESAGAAGSSMNNTVASTGTAGASMDGAAAALSVDLSDLSKQIAAAITQLNSAPRPH